MHVPTFAYVSTSASFRCASTCTHPHLHGLSVCTFNRCIHTRRCVGCRVNLGSCRPIPRSVYGIRVRVGQIRDRFGHVGVRVDRLRWPTAGTTSANVHMFCQHSIQMPRLARLGQIRAKVSQHSGPGLPIWGMLGQPLSKFGRTPAFFGQFGYAAKDMGLW